MSRLVLPTHVAQAMKRDRFFSQNPEEIAQTSIKIISAIQDHPPESQVTAIGLTFVSMCSALQMDPREVLDLLHRMKNEVEKQIAARAGKQYMVEEIANAPQPTETERQVKSEIDAITKDAGGEL